jgi:hypothetical protein
MEITVAVPVAVTITVVVINIGAVGEFHSRRVFMQRQCGKIQKSRQES